MKWVTASEARKNWFRLLDEAARGEVIAIERDNKRLVLRLAEDRETVPGYKGLIRVPNADRADEWGWEWAGSEGLVPTTRK